MPSKQKDSSVTYELNTPVQIGNEKITKIVLAKPKGKHIKHLGKDINLEGVMTVAQKVADVNPLVFDELDADDYLAVQEIIGDFLDSGQKAGKASKS